MFEFLKILIRTDNFFSLVLNTDWIHEIYLPILFWVSSLAPRQLPVKKSWRTYVESTDSKPQFTILDIIEEWSKQWFRNENDF